MYGHVPHERQLKAINGVESRFHESRDFADKTWSKNLNGSLDHDRRGSTVEMGDTPAFRSDSTTQPLNPSYKLAHTNSSAT